MLHKDILSLLSVTWYESFQTSLVFPRVSYAERAFLNESRWLVSQKRWVIPLIKSRFSVTCLVSETSNRDRWERVSISRFRFDCRKRNREAIKSRRFLSSTLRYVAQKQWVIHCFYALPDFLERSLRFMNNKLGHVYISTWVSRFASVTEIIKYVEKVLLFGYLVFSRTLCQTVYKFQASCFDEL